MRYVRVIVQFARVSALNELQYRVNFFVQALQSALRLLVVLGGLGVVFSHTRTLDGWTANQLLALSGIFVLVGGVVNVVIQPSMARFLEDVRMGTLDFVLTKPADAQLLVSVRELQLWRFLDVLLGFALLVLALLRLGSTVGLASALLFIAALLLGAVAVYGAYVALASLAFWFVRVENLLVIFSSLYEAGRWPVGIYPAELRLAITFLAPVSIAVTVPAEAVTGRVQAIDLAQSAAVAAIALIVSRAIWWRGIRRYSGASA